MKKIVMGLLIIILLSIYCPSGLAASVINLDLSLGSISISQNNDGTATYIQNGISTTGTSRCIIRQNNITVPTENTITVTSGTISMTIAGINIETNSYPIYVSNDSILNLTLLDNNIVKSTKSSCAGVEVNSDATLLLSGDGSLNATGGENSAGIGSSFHNDNGNVIIESGNITATGGNWGAGIGGGFGGYGGGNGGNITINDGNIIATGGTYSAGIGGGSHGDGGNIVINGGSVTATGGTCSAGIGGGANGNGGIVFIQNAEVTIKGGPCGIGGGDLENEYGCDSIIIKDSQVKIGHTNSDGENYIEKIFHPTTEYSQYGGLLNSTISLTTNAIGASDLSYQWQVSSNNKNWYTLNNQDNSKANIIITNDNNQYYYRCKLSNHWGNTVYTNSAQCFILEFAKQPEDVCVNKGDTTILEAKAISNDATYQWECSLDNGNSYNSIQGEIYSTLILECNSSENGALYRCVITANNGDTLTSNAAKISIVNCIDVDLSEDGKTYTISPNVDEGRLVILALYKGKSFVNLYYGIYKGEPVPFTVSEDYDTAKVFVWESFSTARPVTEAKEISK